MEVMEPGSHEVRAPGVPSVRPPAVAGAGAGEAAGVEGLEGVAEAAGAATCLSPLPLADLFFFCFGSPFGSTPAAPAERLRLRDS